MCRKITVNSLLPSIFKLLPQIYFQEQFQFYEIVQTKQKLKHTKFPSMIFSTNTNKNDLVFISDFFLPYCSININYLIRMLCDMDLKISFQFCISWFCINDIASVGFLIEVALILSVSSHNINNFSSHIQTFIHSFL